jgi:hypothetical protein
MNVMRVYRNLESVIRVCYVCNMHVKQVRARPGWIVSIRAFVFRERNCAMKGIAMKKLFRYLRVFLCRYTARERADILSCMSGEDF